MALDGQSSNSSVERYDGYPRACNKTQPGSSPELENHRGVATVEALVTLLGPSALGIGDTPHVDLSACHRGLSSCCSVLVIVSAVHADRLCQSFSGACGAALLQHSGEGGCCQGCP